MPKKSFKSKEQVKVIISEAMQHAKDNNVRSISIVVCSDTGGYFHSFYTRTEALAVDMFKGALHCAYADITDRVYRDK